MGDGFNVDSIVPNPVLAVPGLAKSFSLICPSRVAASAIGSGFSLTNERGLLSSGAGGCCWFAVADDEPLITF